jgi:DNA-directed RNA polymerase specialized sigma24 family protein
VSALIDDTDRSAMPSSDITLDSELPDTSEGADTSDRPDTSGSADNEEHDRAAGSDDPTQNREAHDGGDSASASSVGAEHDGREPESAAGEDSPDVDGAADAMAAAGPVPSHSGQIVQAHVVEARVVQDGPATTPAQLRIDFGAHLEANYRRLVAQLYAITLDPAQAHSVVQDAYSRAWRSWATVSRTPDPTGWVRRVAVRSTIRSWRRFRWRSRRTAGLGPGTSVGALLASLRRLPPPERRCVVLHHMAGVSLPEIAAVEGVSVGTTAARLSRAQHVVNAGLIDMMSDVLGPDDASALDGWAVPEWDSPRPLTAGAVDDEEDQP